MLSYLQLRWVAPQDLKSFQALNSVLEKDNLTDDMPVNRLEALRKARQDKVFRLSGCQLAHDGNAIDAATNTNSSNLSKLGAAGKSVIDIWMNAWDSTCDVNKTLQGQRYWDEITMIYESKSEQDR